MRGRVAMVVGLALALGGVIVAGVVGGGAPNESDPRTEGDVSALEVDGGVASETDSVSRAGSASSDESSSALTDSLPPFTDSLPPFTDSGAMVLGAGEIPVLLVPGWLDTARDLAAMRIRLLGAGWPAEFVETLTFEEPTGSNRTHARELAEAIDTLLARTGAEQVDIVAHSMGGLATRWYLRTHPDAPVRRVAFLGSPHRGTLAAHLAWGEGREEMMPDSPFLDTLNTEAPAPDGVEAITIRTAVDTHIVPGENATLPGVVDHELCCPTHPGLLRDDEVFEIVLAFLERGPESASSGGGA